MNYKYNIRGWLTDINNVSSLNSSGGGPSDLFTFKLHYNTPQTEIGNVEGLYNGNISQTQWKTSNDNKLRSYGYEYDALNRINTALFEATSVTPNSYNVGNISYDENGNIKSLKRWMESGTLMDELAYTYDAGNRLLKVKDQGTGDGFKDGTNDGNDYTYDVNGNMIEDQNKGITSIAYNHLNLPREIVFASGDKIEYLYDATGVKLQKKVIEGNKTKVTEYLDGYQYVDGKLEFYPHSEGYVNMKSGTPEYVYNYTDHLGNVRVSYVKGSDGKAKIVEESNYYPFGLKHKGYNNNANTLTDKYKYGYNGKESTEELGYNMLEMDMRQFDPAIARWVVQDPVVHHSMSPYTGFDNNPVFWADPSGADSTYNWDTKRYEDEDGNEVSWNDVKTEYGIGSPPDNITVNSEGQITKVEKNNKSNRFFDESGNELFFNDGIKGDNEDKEAINQEYFVGDFLFVKISSVEYLSAIRAAGGLPGYYNLKAIKAAKNGNLNAANYYYSLAFIEAKNMSGAYGNADFSMSYLTKYAQTGTLRDNKTSQYFVTGNDKTIYNWYDMGNRMWGSWMRANHFTQDAVKVGSNTFELLRFNLGDSTGDQKAIFNGYNMLGH